MLGVRAGVAFCSTVAALCFGLTPVTPQIKPDNLPPVVSIIYPRQGDVMTHGEFFKIKASASDPDGSIAQVQFVGESERWYDGMRETNILGVVTNPPFSLLNQIEGLPCDNHTITLRAVAVDNRGATNESMPVTIYQVCGQPTFTVIEILSPSNGAILASPATFLFKAELLAAGRDTQMQFLVGTNSVGVVHTLINTTDPPISVTVSNLSEGEYKLSVRDQLANFCICGQANIRVVKLGIQSPRLTPDHLFQFEVLMSFPGVETVIQTSPDLLGWTPISTNRPATNTFLFTEASPATNRHQFYRVVLPSQPP